MRISKAAIEREIVSIITMTHGHFFLVNPFIITVACVASDTHINTKALFAKVVTLPQFIAAIAKRTVV